MQQMNSNRETQAVDEMFTAIHNKISEITGGMDKGKEFIRLHLAQIEAELEILRTKYDALAEGAAADFQGMESLIADAGDRLNKSIDFESELYHKLFSLCGTLAEKSDAVCTELGEEKIHLSIQPDVDKLREICSEVSLKAFQSLHYDAEEVRNCGMFDSQWYLAAYSDVAEVKMDPVVHYLKFGAAEGRNPSQFFSTAFYITRYSDVVEAGLNPFIHYIRHGKAEGRIPAPEMQQEQNQ